MNGPMKSIPIDSHGQPGMGMLCSHPLGFCLVTFVTWQQLQDLQKASTSSAKLGHQNHCLVYSRVFLAPRWPTVS